MKCVSAVGGDGGHDLLSPDRLERCWPKRLRARGFPLGMRRSCDPRQCACPLPVPMLVLDLLDLFFAQAEVVAIRG